MGHPLCGPFEQLIIQKTRARQPTLNMHQSTFSSSKSSIPAIRQKTVGIGKATLVAWLFSYIRCFLLKHIQIFIHCCLGPDPSWKVCLIRQIKFIKPKTAAICPYKVLYQRCLAYMAKYKTYVPVQTKFHRKEGSCRCTEVRLGGISLLKVPVMKGVRGAGSMLCKLRCVLLSDTSTRESSSTPRTELSLFSMTPQHRTGNWFLHCMFSALINSSCLYFWSCT